jgi:transposase-like protein
MTDEHTSRRRHRAPYAPEFRRHAVSVWRQSGKSIPEVSRELGISSQTLRRWIREEPQEAPENGRRDRDDSGVAAARAVVAVPGLAERAPAVAAPPTVVRMPLAVRAANAVRGISLGAAAPCFVIVAALASWAVALGAADLSRLSGYGLLAALPPTYYLALVLLTVGFALEASRPHPRSLALGAHVVSLVVMLHATTAILYPEPRYAWTYKHLGVVDYIAVHGHFDRSIDVYQNWPGFFALNAWFSKSTGLAPIDYAAWAQLFFGLANVAVVVFVLRGVTRDPRLVWTAVWIFGVANWIGQDYLAPQAFGFVLVQVVIGLIIRCAPPPGVARTALGRLAQRVIDRAQGVALRGRRPREVDGAGCPVSSRAAVVLGGLCSLAVVVSHQLSPILLILSVGVLTVVRRGPPLWVLAGLVVIQTYWLILSYDFISRHFQVLDFDPAASARPTGAGESLAGAALGANASRAALVLTVLLAAAGVVRRLRAGHWDLVPAALAFAPFLLLGFQSYDGEGPLRAFLFALPWLALFGAAACSPGPRTRSLLRRTWRPVAASVLIGTGALFGYFGQELVNYISRDDVAASRWYLDHAEPGASLTSIAPNFPERLNARYASHLETLPALVTEPAYRPHLLGAADVPSLEALLQRDNSPQRFVAISPSQERYVRFHGLAPPGSLARIAAALRASHDFELVYERGSATIFLYRPR